MATRFCGICGTEVDEDALFCPSCGNPLDAAVQPTSQIPPAPAWPEPEPGPEAEAEEEPEPDRGSAFARQPGDPPELDRGADAVVTADAGAQEPSGREPTPMRGRPDDAPAARAAHERVEPEATRPQSPPPVPPVAPDASRRQAAEQLDLPFTLPVMLSGWLIGIGSLVGALSLLLDFRTFANPVTLIVFLLLLAVAATVFLSSNIPDFANRRLWVLVVVVATFGIGLWRVGLGASFAGVVFFLASLAAAVGAILIELGQDRPMGGPVA